MVPDPFPDEPPPGARYSVLAITALVLGLLGFPALFVWFHSADQAHLGGDMVFAIAFCLLVGFPIAGIISGIVALRRIAASGGMLIGMPTAALGIVLSLLWPIPAFLRYFIFTLG